MIDDILVAGYDGTTPKASHHVRSWCGFLILYKVMHAQYMPDILV